MSENMTDTATAETVVEVPAEPVQDAPGDAEAIGGNREAAKYRRQLRETETERDTLRGQVAALQKAEVERLATGANIKPAALWASGAQLETLLDETGAVSVQLVTAAIAAAVDTLGIPKLPIAPSAYGQGNVGTPVQVGESSDTWQGAFQPKQRR